ncbi:MAG: hypothetical protein ACI9OJ_004017, partial [Myxococcota bacterium]
MGFLEEVSVVVHRLTLPALLLALVPAFASGQSSTSVALSVNAGLFDGVGFGIAASETSHGSAFAMGLSNRWDQGSVGLSYSSYDDGYEDDYYEDDYYDDGYYEDDYYDGGRYRSGLRHLSSFQGYRCGSRYWSSVWWDSYDPFYRADCYRYRSGFSLNIGWSSWGP